MTRFPCWQQGIQTGKPEKHASVSYSSISTLQILHPLWSTATLSPFFEAFRRDEHQCKACAFVSRCGVWKDLSALARHSTGAPEVCTWTRTSSAAATWLARQSDLVDVLRLVIDFWWKGSFGASRDVNPVDYCELPPLIIFRASGMNGEGQAVSFRWQVIDRENHLLKAPQSRKTSSYIEPYFAVSTKLLELPRSGKVQSTKQDLDFHIRNPWRSLHEDPTDKAARCEIWPIICRQLPFLPQQTLSVHPTYRFQLPQWNSCFFAGPSDLSPLGTGAGRATECLAWPSPGTRPVPKRERHYRWIFIWIK